VRLMTHPGVGPVTSLAFVLIIGPVERFERSKQVVSYVGDVSEIKSLGHPPPPAQESTRIRPRNQDRFRQLIGPGSGRASASHTPSESGPDCQP